MTAETMLKCPWFIDIWYSLIYWQTDNLCNIIVTNLKSQQWA